MGAGRMTRATIIALFSGASAGMFVIGVGRIAVFVNPGSSVWSFVAVVAGVAAVFGFGVAERSRSDDGALRMRRLAGVLLLAGIAMILVLTALYYLPIFRSTLVAREADIGGPIVGLIFFPMLLIAMCVRMATNAVSGQAGLVSGAAILGVILGWALVRSPEALLTPAWSIAGAALLLHLAGLSAAWSKDNANGRRSYLSVLTGITAVAGPILASIMASELFFVIGSV